ncbi:hypothetical protein ACFQ1L_36440 [Phytohabitans flavus]|nr:hypothetical protein [Phytohabitans flavus]
MVTLTIMRGRVQHLGVDAWRVAVRARMGALEQEDDVLGRRRAERQAARERQAMEAAGEYLLAGIAGEQARVDDAVSRVDTFLLQAAVVDIAQRAVCLLAQERGVTVDEVVTSLISGSPTTGRPGG